MLSVAKIAANVDDVGADADPRAHAQGEEAPARVERELALEHAVAAVGVGEEALERGSRTT